jgi:hypothetical protein
MAILTFPPLTLTVAPSITTTLTITTTVYKPSDTLNSTYTYPSLFRPGSSQNGIWFLGLAKDTFINIYILKDELVLHVKTGAADGKFFLEDRKCKTVAEYIAGYLCLHSDQ